MSGKFSCRNTACPNKDRGVHLTVKAASECRRAALPVGAMTGASPVAAAPHVRQAPSLATLSEFVSDGVLTESDVLALPEYRDLDHESQSVLLDLIAAGSEFAPQEAAGEDLAEYVQGAYTGFDSLPEWADSELAYGASTLEAGDSVENFAEMALMERIWMLPKRDGSGEFRIMSRMNAD